MEIETERVGERGVGWERLMQNVTVGFPYDLTYKLYVFNILLCLFICDDRITVTLLFQIKKRDV
jgi:hypothetical protein